MGLVWVVANWNLREIARVGPCDPLTALGLAKIYNGAEFIVGFAGDRPVEMLSVREI